MRAERLMNVARWTASGIAFGSGQALPNVGADWVFLLGAYLFVLSALLTVGGRHARGHRARSILAHVALAGDAIAVMGAVIVFAPGPEWRIATPVGVVLIGTGALRGGMGGALASLAATCAAYVIGNAVDLERGAVSDPVVTALTLAAFALAAAVFCAWHGDLDRALTQRIRTAARLRAVERIASDVIYEWDLGSGEMTLGDATAAQLGYAPGGLRVSRGWWEERLHPDDAGPVRDALERVLRGADPQWDMEYRFQKEDGTYSTVHDRGCVISAGGPRPRPFRMIGSLVNVDSVSLYDPVTHLAGRALFTDRVERRAFRVALGQASRCAVLALDLEGWRARSAQLGTDRAHAVLVELARRLERHAGDGETVARLGDERFALLLQADEPEDAIARAAQVRDSIRIPFNGELRLDVRVGAAVLADGEAGDLVSQAFAALADARRTMRRVAVYEAGGQRRWDRHVELREDLRGALERRELRLVFQPMVSTEDGRCSGVEAFVRWQHPQLGDIDAADLLPVATDLELRADIDRYVVRESIRCLAEMRRAVADLRMSVNLSPASLDEGLATSVRALLASALLPGDALTIDLPEDDALEVGPAAAAIAELRALNVEVAIDDVGTGYASTVLARIPATEVKLDRVFGSRVLSDDRAQHIVRSAVERGHDRCMRVVAEGVEEPASIGRLRELGVDLVQGRAVAEPMALDAALRWLAPAAFAADREGDAVEARLAALPGYGLRGRLQEMPG